MLCSRVCDTGKHMGGYHALMHLVKDQLVDPCEPRTINSAIASTGVDTYLPIGRSEK